VVDTDVLADNAVTFGKIGTTEQGQLCKAWVNFDGTGTPSIRAAYNVSSITDNGTGLYTANLTTAMPDANFAVVIAGQDSAANRSNRSYMGRAKSTTEAEISAITVSANELSDSEFLNIAIFR
jgi:hypothetical protein